TAGMMLPAMFAVRSLYSLQKPMILMPCWPRAGPIGCAGVALPAGICSLTIARTFLAIDAPLRSLGAEGLAVRALDQTARPAPSLVVRCSACRHSASTVQSTILSLSHTP